MAKDTTFRLISQTGPFKTIQINDFAGGSEFDFEFHEDEIIKIHYIGTRIYSSGGDTPLSHGWYYHLYSNGGKVFNFPGAPYQVNDGDNTYVNFMIDRMHIIGSDFSLSPLICDDFQLILPLPNVWLKKAQIKILAPTGQEQYRENFVYYEVLRNASDA